MIKCMILWHYYNSKGELNNSSATEFEGTLRDLRLRINEAHAEACRAQEAHTSYNIAQQIVLLP